jgi:hypothetical protein
MSAQDDLVKECLARLRDTGPTWEDDSVDVIAYLKEWHGGFFYSSAGQGLVALLQREWRERNPAFEPFEAPVRIWNLTFWHRRFLHPIVTLVPEKRRIFWCCSPRNVGKGHVVEFLSTPEAASSDVFQNADVVFRGVLDATLLLHNMEKLAMRYGDKAVKGHPPGIIYCDFQHLTALTPSILNALERLSDVGQKLEHGRFRGDEIVLRSHLLVFANAPPPKSLDQRCVWLLQPQSLADQPLWEYPFVQPGHAAANAVVAAISAAVPLPEDVPVAPVAMVPAVPGAAAAAVGALAVPAALAPGVVLPVAGGAAAAPGMPLLAPAAPAAGGCAVM